jgi:SAM-dependent methyltransferase
MKRTGFRLLGRASLSSSAPRRSCSGSCQHRPRPSPTSAAGPGRYAFWLAGLGYRVLHRDIVPLHVAQVRELGGAAGSPVETALGDARGLDLADASVDAVLLLGPLYHLTRRADRVQALPEARRVVRPGGLVFGAAISRWAPRLDGILRLRLYERTPEFLELIGPLERTGIIPPLVRGGFNGYGHRPGQLHAEFRSAGLAVADMVSVEGAAFLLGDLDERMADPAARQVVLDCARVHERVPELLGIGPHLLATGRRP